MIKSKDIQLMDKYYGVNNTSGGFNGLEVLATISETYGAETFNIIDMIDLDVLQSQTNEYLEYCRVLKRFRKLRAQIGEEFSFAQPSKILKYALTSTPPDQEQPSHFLLSGHMFSSLDEIEKAWKNKAFL